jgi:hypothetical protein
MVDGEWYAIILAANGRSCYSPQFAPFCLMRDKAGAIALSQPPGAQPPHQP